MLIVSIDTLTFFNKKESVFLLDTVVHTEPFVCHPVLTKHKKRKQMKKATYVGKRKWQSLVGECEQLSYHIAQKIQFYGIGSLFLL